MNNCNKKYQTNLPSTSFSLVYEKKKTCNIFKNNNSISQQNYILNKKNYITKRNINKNEHFNDIFINPNCEFKQSSRLIKKICN